MRDIIHPVSSHVYRNYGESHYRRDHHDPLDHHYHYNRMSNGQQRRLDDHPRYHGDVQRAPLYGNSLSNNDGVDWNKAARDELYTRVLRNNYHNHTVENGERAFRSYQNYQNDPIFEVDHLATYVATKRGLPGLVSIEEGLSKLRSMELMTGVWTMRCFIAIERHRIVVLDNITKEEQDHFPLELVHKPTAIVRNDPREIYNNLLIFTVVTDPRKGDPDPSMHIFLSVTISSQIIADEIQAAKEGKSRISLGYQMSNTLVKPTPEQARLTNVQQQAQSFQRIIDNRNDLRRAPSMYNRSRVVIPPNHMDHDDQDQVNSESIEFDMRKLNACCDDIEVFVSRLQQAAEAFHLLEKREMERRKRDPKNHKTKHIGDGVLTMRARPPPANDYIEIFQKFKYAFNILARLKPYIHDPNAPELVHFLFTPLNLINEACRDHRNGAVSLSASAVAPLLTKDAKNLLLNCLTSSEQEFWMSLGDAWYLTKDQYHGYVPPFTPRFLNGWQPTLVEADEESYTNRNGALPVNQASPQNHYDEYNIQNKNFPPPPPVEILAPRGNINSAPDHSYTNHNYSNHNGPAPPTHYHSDPNSVYQNKSQPSPKPLVNPHVRGEANLAFARELQSRGARLVQIEHARQGKNSKELTVEGGDILEVIDSSRNWWRLRNCYGEIGHAPYTIFKEIRPEDQQNHSPFGR